VNLEMDAVTLESIQRWGLTAPEFPTPGTGSHATLASGGREASRFFLAGDSLLRRLPARPLRKPDEHALAERLLGQLRAARERFLGAWAEPLYADLTAGYARLLRVDELVYAAAARYPGLTPGREIVEAERGLLQKDKDGAEVDQGLLLSAIFAGPRPGAHLIHAMQQPKAEALERLSDFRGTGTADLGVVEVRREGRAGHVLLKNRRFLNAEDDAATAALETGVDLILLDPDVEVGVLRGAPLDHPRYAGRRVFQAGINLTHLYHGKISFVDFFITREVGFINKIFRGLAPPDFVPHGPERTSEKPWIAAVEGFAIGGGCQILLVMDRVIAERGAYFNLPARKEGIIPGLANLRLPRMAGERLARQGIFFERRFEADSPEGRLICDETVEPGEMDAAIARTVEQLTASGTVSAAANRKALRAGQEPLATFQAYMALYAREQAFCQVSPALIANLDRYWNAQARRP
jgi:(3,5-dihydroxyphenyl)acetyl-CoA 1,2-dioxygenase